MNKVYTLFNLFLSFILAKNPHGYPVRGILYDLGNESDGLIGACKPSFRAATTDVRNVITANICELRAETG